jgi:hypothetical protein
VAYVLGQLEQPHQMRGDQLRVRGAVAFDEGEPVLRVEALHHDGGAAEALGHRRPARRRGVVERRRAQVHGRLREPVQPDEQPGEGLRLAERAAPQRRLHALRPARGPRRVEHPRALALVADGFGGHRRHGVGVGLEAGEIAADGEARADAVEVGAHAGHRARQPGVGHEGPGAAVGDYVAGLGCGQVKVDRRDIQAGAQRAPHDLVPGRTIHEQHGDPVAGPQPTGPQQLGDAVRGVLELAVGQRLAAGAHHEGVLVAVLGDMGRRVLHGPTV